MSCYDLACLVRGLALVVCGLLVSSCGDGPTAPNPADYQNVEWRLATLQRPDSSVVSAPAGVTLTARFDDDGTLAVRADCNSCHARYTVSGALLSVSPMACTLIACPSAPLDGEYARILSTATALEMEGSSLALRSPEGTLRFRR
jgi:heat shock protein HslJ